MKLVKCSKQGRNYLLTFQTEPSWWSRLWGTKPRWVQYVGDGTAWLEFPGFGQCDAATCKWLSDVLNKVKLCEAIRSSGPVGEMV